MLSFVSDLLSLIAWRRGSQKSRYTSKGTEPNVISQVLLTGGANVVVLAERGSQPTHFTSDAVAWQEMDAEISPEEFYRSRPSQMATGHFAPTSHVDFSQSETDWDKRELLADELSQMVGDRRRGKSTLTNEPEIDLPAQHTFLVAVENLRAQAEARRWLSPKSAVALSKLMLGNEDLSPSELNALGYLLDRMAGGPGLDVYTAGLKKYLFAI